VDKLLVDIAKYEYGQSREPLTTLTDLIRSLDDRPDTIAQIERRLLRFLQSDATPAARQFICRQLSIIGTEEAVPVLIMMLFEKPTSEIQPADMARYALERIPSPAADWGLRNALDKTRGRVKVGVINSLGNRGDKKAVEQLKALLSDSDKEIVGAAMSALGKIGGAEAAAALDSARPQKTATAEMRLVWANASLACADKLLAEGMRRQAWYIYNRLYGAGEPVQVRTAAFRGMVATKPKQASRIIIGALEGDDEQMQSAAIGLLSGVSGEELTKVITDRLPSLSVTGQVQMLAALAGRGDPSALPAVLAAVGSDSVDVRVAALAALGSLGGASTVDLLAKTAAEATGPEQQAARDSLYRLRPPEVDQKILAGIGASDAKVKVELIRSIGERNMTEGVDALMKTAKDPEAEVRIESLKTLKAVAGAQYLSQLLDLLMAARTDAERREAADTAAAVVRKSAEDQRAQHVLTIIATLPSVKDVAAKSSLLNVLGKIGDDSALPVLRASLKDSDVEVRSAAVRVLSEWPTDKPADALLAIARSSDDQRQRILALRGYIRMIGLDRERPAAKTVKMYAAAMQLASEVGEKKTVLSGLANVKSLEALQLAADYLADSALQQEAAAAVVRIAQSTRADHPGRTKAVLQKVVEVSKNEGLRQQAQKLIDEIN
jgi:HEAT repeat protein